MGRPRKDRDVTPRFCAWCERQLKRKRINGRLEDNGAFERRKYCNRKCMSDAMVQGAQRTDHTSRTHARELISRSIGCELCGCAGQTHVHHRDGNPQNNATENLQRLCPACHRKVHRPRKYCSVCGEPVTGFGYCSKHYQRFKKWGSPYVVKRNQHSDCECIED